MRQLALVLGCALVLAACGDDTKTVDDAQIEQGIERSISTSQVEVTSVKCPTDEKSEVGNTFDCSVKLSNGGTGKVEVEQTGRNNFSYTLKDGSVQIPGSVAEEQIEKQLATEGIQNASVNCPDNIIVKVGTTVTCDIASAQGTTAASVTYTFSEADGEVDPDSVETS